MPTFRYRARDARGKVVAGRLAASNAQALAEALRRDGFVLTAAQESAGGLSLSRLNDWQGVGPETLAIVTLELAKLVQVGIPLLTGLRTVAAQADHAGLRRALGDIAERVEAGSSFSDALRRHARFFPDVFVHLVRAGEASGRLDEALRRLSDFAKRNASVKQQLVTALLYPAFLAVFGLLVIVFLVHGVIPKFMTLFVDAGVPLPGPTRLLYGASQAMQRYGLFFAGALVSLGFAAAAWRRTASGRWRSDQWILGLPAIGPLTRQIVLSRACRTLETLLSSGVPILEALEMVESACGNAVIGRAFRQVHESVKQGGTLSEPLRASREIPPMAVEMIAVGESSGTVDQMLSHIADHYDGLVEHGIRRVTAFVEPLFLVMMGGMVAFIMASLLMPLFRLVSLVR